MVLERPLRAAILAAADNAYVRRIVTAHGMRFGAARFVAGRTAQEFLTVAKAENAQGFAVAAGILGEGTRSARDARVATQQYCDLLEQFDRENIDANVALKPTHLGLDIDPALAMANIVQVASCAQRLHNTMRLDMEQSAYVDRTLELYRGLKARGFQNVGFVLQSALRRSVDDLEALLPMQTNVRIVKGAYLESASVAFPEKRDVDKNYVHLAQRSLSVGAYTAIATHDTSIVDALLRFVSDHGVSADRFEFQLLYGVSAPLARRLVKSGYRVRLAVPFGTYWFPYLMRRLAERPSNVGFLLRNAFLR